MGIKVGEERNRLTIAGSRPRGSVIDTKGDHRIAMAFSILGSVAGETIINDAGCVSKTLPKFWELIENIGGEVKRDGE